ncbi:B12-binding domain-containing radical SAM protein [Anoxybacillus flavithermus]|uniref:Radical SAM protein n=2 Tax=Anoxybacillus flavithermus TaxID=33934 RepID=R4G6W0_9BACL|nr:radical SAM protein [Anoxybacillus flavithermus]ACJ34798.1 Radical SAM superfamily enzyme [Anoxybacillus flavithermus WK1]AST06270.1 B12-binding domain-containing radical SAM protein [Anoxybacillus flavithermus]GAC91617.1 radical SAM protein [Anoxybacillus flavithermus NBRC 109594]
MRICLFTVSARGFNLPPYGIWALKAYVDKYAKENNLNVHIDVLNFGHDSSVKTIIDGIKATNPDLVGASHYIWNDKIMMDLLPKLKEELNENVYVIVGGPHADVTDERLKGMIINKLVDALVIGEGEIPLFHIIKCIATGRDISPIDGLFYKKDNEIIPFKPQTISRGNLNYLPNPYKQLPELVELSLKAGSFQYETSRGCPFSCTFCDQGHKAYRSLTMERIKEDLEFFAKIKVKHIDFLDGTFNLNPKRTIELLNYLINLNTDWSFHAEIKPENLTVDEINLMAKAKFQTVELGLQSIHPQTLKYIKRRNRFSVIEKNINHLLEVGISIVINTIIGLPGESLKDWYESLDYCFNLGKVKILSNVLKILPNTELASQIEEFGFNFSRDELNAVRSTKYFSAQDIKKAIIINKLVDVFWNKVNTPNSIKMITNELFEGKFHLFLESVFFLINQKPELLKGNNFHNIILNEIIDSKKINNDIKNTLKKQVNIDFSNQVGVIQ